MASILYYHFSYYAVALFLAVAVVPLMRPLAFRLGAVDTGTGRRVHTGVIPRLGGFGIFLAFTAPLIFSLTRGTWDTFHDRMVGILIASTVVFCIGAYDDLKGATIRNKLIAEVLAGLIIYSWGIRITVITNPFGGAVSLGLLSLPVTILWVVVITNAVNLIDGLDGLAAGTGILISLTMVAVSGGDTHLQLAYVILAGALTGFLLYNFPPASIFMGDAGSLFVGFFLAAISILSSHKATAMATIMVPIIAFSLPLMDMLYAVIRRYYRGIPLGEADREHIHHKLLERGLSKKAVLFLLYGFNISLMAAVLLLVQRQRNLDFIGLVLLGLVAAGGLRLLGYVRFIPFFRDLRRNYDLSRKRKYYCYLITRFRRAAEQARDLDELSGHLRELMASYGFDRVKIFLNPQDSGSPFFSYGAEAAGQRQRPVVFSFPIMAGEEQVGYVYMSKDSGDDYLLCTAALAQAISDEVARLMVTSDVKREG